MQYKSHDTQGVNITFILGEVGINLKTFNLLM
jgi:hypothetical protein